MFEKKDEEKGMAFVDVLPWRLEDMTSNKISGMRCWKDGFECGYNKANEWHKITDKLPEMGELVYLWTNDKFPIIACRQHGEIDWYWNCKQGDYYINRLASIDAGYLWKEIVPPKLTNDKKE